MIWGPLVWGYLHGLAHTYDATRPTAPGGMLEAYVHLLVYALAWVLPCLACRESFMQFLTAPASPTNHEALKAALRDRTLTRFMWTLHNLVNLKLDRPLFPSLELVHRRALVWPMQSHPTALFHVLFIIAMNYDANSEPEKVVGYRLLLQVLPHVHDLLGASSLAQAMLSAGFATAAASSQLAVESMVQAGYAAHRAPLPTPSLQKLRERFDLCRSQGSGPT